MGKSLIITEKPSVAQEFAKVLRVSGRNDGYIENGEYVISWCVGHLVGLVYPESYDMKYKKWRLEDLPFLPKEYKYDVIDSVRKQYNIVHALLQREDIDRVYWAGDAGKEGQTIEENIRNFGGVREGMEELRVWIDSQTEEEILRGIKEAKPMSAYANLGKSGIMRTIEDYAMGINFSRVMSVKYGNLLNDAAGTRSYTAIAVGRVMTCVLGMVVIREREIRNFKETPFYRVIGRFTDAGVEAEWKAVEGSRYFESPLLYKENGFKEEKDALALIEELNGKQAKVKSIVKNITKKRAPLLFNLAELQAECSKKFKISPDETLQVAQDLYEKKLTTYPRTDARVLSSAVAKEIGLDEVHAELLPGDKVDRVEALLKALPEGRKLAFVGDGINDAPVLSRADVGIAMGSMGSDAAIEAADVVLMDDDPRKIADIVRISRKTMGIVMQNIVFALGVKFVVLAMGAFGVANMWEAVFADVGVSVIAILNAMRALRA